MGLFDNVTDCINSRNSYYLNHLENDPIIQSSDVEQGVVFKNSKGMSLCESDGKILYYATHIFPILTIFQQPAGLALRAFTDTVQCFRTENEFIFPTLKVMFSASSVFSSVIPAFNYLQQIELCRSIVIRCETLYHLSTKQQEDKWGWKIQQQALHLTIDLCNVAICFRGSLYLRIFSQALQVVASVIDFLEQKHENSYFGMGMQSLLGAVRLSSLIATGQELHHAWYPKEIDRPEDTRLTSTTIQNEKSEPASYKNTGSILPNPVSAQMPEQFSRLYQLGTGSDELNKLQVIKHLGNDGIISELFLVKDEQGNTLVLKRFLSESEQIHKSTLYALFYVMTFPLQILRVFIGDIRVNECNKSLEISQNAADSNLIKVFKVIQNKYFQICEKTGESKAHHDVYLLMEYFEGTSIEKMGSSNNTLSTIESIAKTLLNVSGLGYFYNTSSLDAIKINPETNQLKFVSFSGFSKMVTESSWKTCIDMYENLHKLFVKLMNLSPSEEKDRLISKLNELFNHQNLVEQFRKAKEIPLSEEVQKKMAEVFNADLLKQVLKQVQELFCLGDG